MNEILERIKEFIADPNKRKYLIGGVLAVVVLIVLITAFKGSGGKTIENYDSNWIAVDKKGNAVDYTRDKNGNMVVPKFSKKALARLGISEEDAKRMVNPYALMVGEDGKPIILVYATYQSNGKEKLSDVQVQYGLDYEKDAIGMPIKDEDGNIKYIQNNTEDNTNNQTTAENNTNNEENTTTPTSDDIPDDMSNEEPEEPRSEIELTEEDLEDIHSDYENKKNEIYVEEYEEDPKNVNLLEEVFFKRNPDWNTIKELPYRDLGVQPKSKATNPFIYYNWEGLINPYKFEGYLNRFIYGIAFNYSAIENGFEYKLNTINNTDTNTPPVSLSISIDKTQLLKEFKKAWMIIQDMGVFPELDDANLDNLSYVALERVTPSIIVNSEDSLKYYKQKDYNYKKDDGSREAWMYKTRKEMISTLNKVNEDKLTNDLLTRLRVQCFQKVLEDKYNAVRREACQELNKYQDSLCNDWTQIVPLEIRSDFMQMIYETSLKESTKLFVEMVQDIQGEIRSNKLNQE